MTDERLDQILKQALAPKISEEDIHVKKSVRSKKMNKMVKRGIAVAACAALVATFGMGINYRNIFHTNEDSSPFTISVYAAELEEGKTVPVILGQEQCWALGGDGDTDTVDYVIKTDFRCEGENIESITYSINQGAFNVSEMPGDSIIMDEVAYEGDIHCGDIGVAEDEEGNIISENRFLKEYTVRYDAQTDDKTVIAICGEKSFAGAVQGIWGEDQNNYEEQARIYDTLLDGVEITCTAHFTDGTSASQVITVGGRVMTYAEAGMCDEGDTYETGESGDTEGAFFAFELKE